MPLSVDWHFSSTGRCQFVIFGLFRGRGQQQAENPAPLTTAQCVCVHAGGYTRQSAWSMISSEWEHRVTPRMIFSFPGGLLTKHKAEWRASYCIVLKYIIQIISSSTTPPNFSVMVNSMNLPLWQKTYLVRKAQMWLVNMVNICLCEPAHGVMKQSGLVLKKTKMINPPSLCTVRD